MVSVGKFDWPAQYGGQRGGISSALGAMTTANSEPICDGNKEKKER